MLGLSRVWEAASDGRHVRGIVGTRDVCQLEHRSGVPRLLGWQDPHSL